MSKIYDKLFFAGPSSMGDLFVYNGVTHHFADHCEELHLPALSKFFKTAECLYRDYPNIKVCAIDSAEDEFKYIETHKLSRINRNDMFWLQVGDYVPAVFWDMQIYDFFDLPFSKRYKNFRMPKVVPGADELYNKLTNGEEYILIHRRRGLNSEPFPIDIENFRRTQNLPEIKTIEIEEGITDNMLEFSKLIENAKEIHCAPSSFFCFVDSILDKTSAALYYHNIRAQTLMRVNSKWNNYRWTIVNYSQKF